MKLRFTIRDLLWLAVVVALSVGWLLDHNQLSNQVQQLASPYYRFFKFGERFGPTGVHGDIPVDSPEPKK